jgi:NAD dependent epimerase/dehydratase
MPAPKSSGWSGRRVLVTGAGGFIGSHLTEALAAAGASVRAFVRYTSRNHYGWLEFGDPTLLSEVEIFPGDLANPEAVANAVSGCDVVLHLGALIPIPYSYRHPREFVSANVIGTLNVLEAARREGTSRVVHTSTSEVYGTPETVPISEGHPIRAQSPYAATKAGADQLALSYKRSFGTPVVIVRPFNTFGPRQSARAVIPTIVTQALEQDAIELGATAPTRDFLYVSDTVRGIMRCAEVDRIEGEVINLGTGVEISVRAVVEQVLGIVRRDLAVTVSGDRLRPAESEVERLVADCSKAERMLGWAPAVNFDEGLRKTIEWMTGALANYKVTVYNV